MTWTDGWSRLKAWWSGAPVRVVGWTGAWTALKPNRPVVVAGSGTVLDLGAEREANLAALRAATDPRADFGKFDCFGNKREGRPDRDAVEEGAVATLRAKRESGATKVVEPTVWALAAAIETESKNTLRWHTKLERRIAKLERAAAKKKPNARKARAKR